MALTTVSDIEISLRNEDIPKGWESTFINNIDAVNRMLTVKARRGRCYPSDEDFFAAFRNCPLKKVRVVIVGQDPYTDPNLACGMSFSIPRGRRPPSSLVNIFKCIKKSYPEFRIPDHGDLTSWSHQGVLLLNMCLGYFPDAKLDVTERKFCTPFIAKVIEDICLTNPKVIFVLWGNEAQNGCRELIHSGITKLVGIHPSGLNGDKFVKQVNHFREINNILEVPIDWQI